MSIAISKSKRPTRRRPRSSPRPRRSPLPRRRLRRAGHRLATRLHPRQPKWSGSWWPPEAGRSRSGRPSTRRASSTCSTSAPWRRCATASTSTRTPAPAGTVPVISVEVIWNPTSRSSSNPTSSVEGKISTETPSSCNLGRRKICTHKSLLTLETTLFTLLFTFFRFDDEWVKETEAVASKSVKMSSLTTSARAEISRQLFGIPVNPVNPENNPRPRGRKTRPQHRCHVLSWHPDFLLLVPAEDFSW